MRKTEQTLFTGYQLCPTLVPREICFCVRAYAEGKFLIIYHGHVPKIRMSNDRMLEATNTLVARYSEWPGDWIVSSLLNSRKGKPQRYPGLTHDVSHPEPGALRHAVSGTNVHAWCDTVISSKDFRAMGDPNASDMKIS